LRAANKKRNMNPINGSNIREMRVGNILVA